MSGTDITSLIAKTGSFCLNEDPANNWSSLTLDDDSKKLVRDIGKREQGKRTKNKDKGQETKEQDSFPATRQTSADNQQSLLDIA